MRYIVPTDGRSPDRFSRQLLAGPGTGIDTCTIARIDLPAGHAGALAVNAADVFFYSLEGLAQVQIGTENFALEPHTLAFVPAGATYRVSCSGAGRASCLEIVVPGTGEGAVAVETARPFPEAAELIQRLRKDAFTSLIRGGHEAIEGFGLQALASRDTGSKHVNINVAEVQPDSGGPRLHIHPFDQFYFVLKGTLDIQIGLARHTAPEASLVVLPAGVVHANWNGTPDVEMHLVIMTPSLMPGETASFPVSIATPQASAAQKG